MKIQSDYVEYVPATPEDVLRVLADQYRLTTELNYGFSDLELTFETTVEDWRVYGELVGWRRLARVLNEEWNIDRDIDEWSAVLTPERQRTLGDVCHFVAETALLPRIKPAHVAGVECRSVGAFLAVRDMLASAGADVSEIMPSTLLSNFQFWLPECFWRMSYLSPSALTISNIPVFERPAYDQMLLLIAGVTSFCAMLGPLMLPLVIGFPFPLAVVIAVTLTLLTWVINLRLIDFTSSRWAPINFGDLVTFRDLAVRLAGLNS